MSSGGTLVVGASGLVGSHLLRHYRTLGAAVAGTGRDRACGTHRLDITQAQDVRALIAALAPRTVVLAAALTDVDRCQRQPQLSYAVNVAGARHVAEAAALAGSRLVYLSTDYVFDGKNGPYAECDQPHPVCVYCRHKAEAEAAVRGLLGTRCLIVRTTGVFGRESPARNFVARLIDRTGRGESVRVPTDQVGSPTYAGELAAAVAHLDRAGAAGDYHVAGRTPISRYDFALLASDVFGLRRELILPVATADLGQDAPRPLKAGLLVRKAEAFLARPLATARGGLEAMLRETWPER